jgi:hypothetical protein
MQLWQIGIVGGVIADPRTGEPREARVVTRVSGQQA